MIVDSLLWCHRTPCASLTPNNATNDEHSEMTRLLLQTLLLVHLCHFFILCFVSNSHHHVQAVRASAQRQYVAESIALCVSSAIVKLNGLLRMRYKSG
jgi:hypothetical protein